MLAQFRRYAFLLVVLSLLGCNREKVRNLIDSHTEEVQQGLKDARDPAPAKSYDPLTISDKMWTGNTSIRMRHGLPLPPRYEGAHGVVFISQDPIGIDELASVISAQTGIPLRIAAGVSSGGSAAPIVASNGIPGMASSSSGASSVDGMNLSYEGSLSGLLDLIAAHFGLNWRYDGSSVNFSRYETRVFMVESLPGTQSVKDGMKEDSGSSGSSSTGASSTSALQQSSEMNVEIKYWDELGQTMTAMLNGVGSVVLAPSSGTVTVTTTPEIMQTIADFLKQENKRLSRQIAINVEVYKVDLSEGTDFSLSYKQAVANMLGSKWTMTGTQGPALVQGSPLSSTTTDTSSTTTSVTGFGPQAGSLMVSVLNGNLVPTFMALSAVGNTSRIAQFPLTTLNNRPVSRRIGRDRAYVQQMTNTTSTTTTGTTSVTITPGTIREGFSLQLTPRLLEDGRIMLQYSMSLVDIVNMTTFGTDENKVQLPETASRVFVQQSVLRSASTLVIGGYDDETTGQDSQGVGNAFNYLLGGGSSSEHSHSMLFIAITPRVLDDQSVEQR